MKLARELSKRQTGKTLYLLDEPTTGLHFDDVRKLLEVLHRLVDLGNSVIIIEHNLDVIRNADWVLDLGPEGGEDGGRVVGQGRPAQIAQTPGSYTGQFLKRYYTSADGHLEEEPPEEEALAEIAKVDADPKNAGQGLDQPNRALENGNAKSRGKGSSEKKPAQRRATTRKKKTGLP
jgi:excinuclease ABC subunit A